MATKFRSQNGFGYKTRQQIASEYEVCEKTLKKKLSEKGVELPKGRVSPRFQKQIYDALSYPLSISKKDYEQI